MDGSCFKAYDIRGRVPGVLNAPLARALGRAVVEILGAKSVVIGRDARLSGPELRDALARGLREAGAQVTDIGMDGRFQVKRIIVNPGAELSLQMHHHRAEHWVVVSGTAEVTNGDLVKLFTENQSTYIPVGTMARCGRAVQADGCGYFVGCAAPIVDNGGLYFCVCKGGKVAL